MTPSSAPRIAIIGCGPAGLTVGLLLHKHGIPFTIFELRQKPTGEELSRPSGSLDLHAESGLAAIAECGLTDEFLRLTGECAESQRVADRHGNIVFEDAGRGDGAERPEISRHALTKLLLSQIPADAIRWGHKLLSATGVAAASSSEPDHDRQVELDFGPHGRQTFDLVVGADGAWSRVRNLLTDAQPDYAGKQCVTLTIRQITRKHPRLAELIGRGSFIALGNRHGVITQRGAQDSARIYVFLTTADENFATTHGLADQTATEAKGKILNDNALLGTWGAPIKELVAAACDEETADNPGAKLDIRPLYVLAIGHEWEHRPGATIVGDAAHLMGPWAGEGANLAMWDSTSLAHAVIKAYESAGKDSISFNSALDPLLKSVEAELVARAREKAEETHSNGEMMFGENGARDLAEFFLSLGPPPTE